MAYEPLAPILSRRGEKVAMFLTIENLVGILIAIAPAYLLTRPIGGIVQIVVIVGCGLLGYVATLEQHGMSFYERVFWRLRGRLRQFQHGSQISPESLPTAVAQSRGVVSRRGAIVQPRRGSISEEEDHAPA